MAWQFGLGFNFLGQEPGVKVFKLGLSIDDEEPSENPVHLVTIKVDPLVLIEPDINHMKIVGDVNAIPATPGASNYSIFEESTIVTQSTQVVRQLAWKALYMLSQYITDDGDSSNTDERDKWHYGLNV